LGFREVVFDRHSTQAKSDKKRNNRSEEIMKNTIESMKKHSENKKPVTTTK